MRNLIPEFKPMLRRPALFMLVLLTTLPYLARGQTVPVPENIRAADVPPIAARLPRP